MRIVFNALETLQGRQYFTFFFFFIFEKVGPQSHDLLNVSQLRKELMGCESRF